MKMLLTADWHIAEWSKYSSMIDGMSSRLLAYQTLAQDIVQKAIDEKCRVIVLAGDTAEAPKAKDACVVNMIYKVIETLSPEGIDLIITTGQHDMDTRTRVNDPDHVLITPLASRKANVHYCPSPRTVKIDGLSFFVCPWQTSDLESSVTLEPADVFVGHGIVAGSKDPHGYAFKGTIQKGVLWENYRLSVVGDIHQHQTFEREDGRVIIVPSTPIQNTFKDSPDVGFVIAEVKRGKSKPKYKFHSTYELRDDGTYHKFLYSDSIEVVQGDHPPHIHYTFRGQSDFQEVSDQAQKAIDALVEVDTRVYETCIDVLRAEQPDNVDGKSRLLAEAYEIANTGHSLVPRKQSLKKLEIENFLSIDSFSLDFEKVRGDILLLGENGSGKSSVAEAIGFALFGQLTKDVKMDSVSNLYTEKPFDLKLTLTVDGVDYMIHRFMTAGKSGAHKIHVYELSGDADLPITRSTQSETQELIVNLLGVTWDKYQTLSYFSQNQTKLFNDLKGSEKHEFLGQLAGQEQFDAIKEAVSRLTDKTMNDGRHKDGARSTLVQMLNQKKAALEKAKASASRIDRSLLDQSVASTLTAKVEHIAAMSLDAITDMLNQTHKAHSDKLDTSAEHDAENFNAHLKALTGDIHTMQTTQQTLAQESVWLDKQIAAIKVDCTRLNEQVQKVETGVCPMCTQSLPHNHDALNELKTQFDQKVTEYRELLEKQTNNSSLRVDCDARYAQLQETAQKAEAYRVELEDRLQKNQRIQTFLSSIQAELQRVNMFQSSNREQLKDSDLAESLQTEVDDLVQQVEEIDVELAELTVRENDLSWLYKKLLAKNGKVIESLTLAACNALTLEINHLVGDYALYHAKVVPAARASIDIEVSFKRGRAVPMGSMSGGEKRLNDILVLIALNNLFSRKYKVNGIAGITIFDETFQYLDAANMEIAVDALKQSLSENRIVITHEPTIQREFSRRIYVENGNPKGSSRYKFVVD